MAASEAQERRRAEQLVAGRRPLEAGTQLGEQRGRPFRGRAGRDDLDEVAERRIAELLPPLELTGEELVHRVARCEGDRSRVRRERLHDHAARAVAAAAPRELREELEHTLLGPEVGDEHPGVGVDDRRQADAREVMPLRHHLRTEQHGALGRGEALEDAPVAAVGGGGVRVEPEELELRNPNGQLLLEPLGTRAEAGDLGGAAHRAERRRLRA